MPTPTAASIAEPLPLEYMGPDPALGRPTKFRWVILTLVFFAITINYIDRMVLGLLADDIKGEYKIDDQAYGWITAAFSICYAFGQAASGRWLDWIGTRIGYAVALFGWSVASMLHAVAGGAWSFGVMRGLLGVTESPAYPAATKTLAEWFPKKERAFAMGFVNAGSNVGAVLAPIIVAWLSINYGWRWAFIVTGAIGLIWLFFWIPLYRRPHQHRKVNAAELAYINSDPPDAPGKVRWLRLLRHKQAWAFALGKFMTDPIWSFYLFWLPTFFKSQYGVALKDAVWPMVTIYGIADLGSIAGGWLSSRMLKRGVPVNRARKIALLVCALCAAPAAFVYLYPGMWTVTVVIGIALAAHQGFSSNLYTLVSDMFPRKAVGSVAGLGGTFGYIGTSLFMAFVGWVVTVTNKNYLPVFIIAACAYLVALGLIHLLAPRMEQADIDGEGTEPRGFEVLPPAGPAPR